MNYNFDSKGIISPIRSLPEKRYLPGSAYRNTNEASIHENLERSRMMELNDEVQYNKTFTDLLKKISMLGDELKATKKALNDVEIERNKYQSKTQFIEKDYERLHEENMKLNDKYKRLNDEFENNIMNYNEEINHMKEIIGQLENKIVIQKSDYDKEEERIYKLKEDHEITNKQLIRELNDIKAENEKLIEKLLTYQKNEDEMNAVISELREEFVRLKDSNKDLSIKIEKFANEKDNMQILLTSEKEETENLLKKLAIKHKECEELYSRKALIRTESADTTKTDTIIIKQGKLIEMLRNTVNDDKEIIQRQEIEKNRLQNELLQLKEEVQKYINNDEPDTENLLNQIKFLQNANRELEMKLEEIKEENTRLNEEINEFAKARQELTNARIKEIDRLSKAINDSYEKT